MEALNIINELLTQNNINYAFERWNDNSTPTFWTGECDEGEPIESSQKHEINVYLIGHTRKNWSDLYKEKSIIENLFKPLRHISPNGSAIVIQYAGLTRIPSKEADLKRLQIKLKIKEWRIPNNE